MYSGRREWKTELLVQSLPDSRYTDPKGCALFKADRIAKFQQRSNLGFEALGESAVGAVVWVTWSMLLRHSCLGACLDGITSSSKSSNSVSDLEIGHVFSYFFYDAGIVAASNGAR